MNDGSQKKEYLVQVADVSSQSEIKGVPVYTRTVDLFVRLAVSDLAGSATPDTILALEAALKRLKEGVLEN